MCLAPASRRRDARQRAPSVRCLLSQCMSLRPRTPTAAGRRLASASCSLPICSAGSTAQQLLRRGEKPQVGQSAGDMSVAPWADLYHRNMVTGFIRLVPGKEHNGRAMTVRPPVEDMLRQPTRKPGVATRGQFVLNIRVGGDELEPCCSELE